MELREKIARKHWLACLRRVLRAQGKALSYIDSWKETDFDKQELIDKEPYYTFADQILTLIKKEGKIMNLQKLPDWAKEIWARYEQEFRSPKGSGH